MSLINYCLFLSFFFSIGSAFAVDVKDLLPVQQAFKFSAEAEADQQLHLQWEIADGYYLYKDKIAISSDTPGIEIAVVDMPKGKSKHDEYFGEMEIYRKYLSLTVPYNNTQQVDILRLQVKHQGCADIGVCYPPQKESLQVALADQHTGLSGSFGDLVNGLSGAVSGMFGDDLLPPDEAFQFLAEVKDPNTLRVSWLIADGYYLYREKISLQLLDSGQTVLGAYAVPHGKPQHDEAFGSVEIFYQQLAFDVPLQRTNSLAHSIRLQAAYQGCAERGVCYPPMRKTAVLELPVANSVGLPKTSANTVISEQQQIAWSLQHDSFWLTLLSFLGFGLLLSLTPCVFPMIPILSGIIVGQGGETDIKRSFLLSLSFVLASALTYTAFGIIAAIFGSNLQATLQQPWVIVVFSLIFIMLSLSMFGFYHLQLPKSWQAGLHDASDKQQKGSYFGAAIMGALSSLIVGPCVAAPLAGALIYIGQTGDAILGGSALFVMGLGMGAPLLLFGASAGRLLPKAGAWMNVTQSVFGVLMLAVAVWMLDRVLPGEITMLLWAMLLIIPAIYLSAIDPLPADASNWRKLWKGAGLISLVYGVLLLIGISMGNINPLKPLQGLNVAQAGERRELALQKVNSVQQLQEQLAIAAKQNKWVMLDFYADWCISCKEMEAYTFSNPDVQRKLADYVLLQADVTENTAVQGLLLKRFNLIGPPAILFFNPQQLEKPELRVVGYMDSSAFLAHLNKI